MAKKRAFSSSGIEEKSEDYHGTCRYVRTSPDIATKGIQSVNIDMTFEEALRLSTAVQSAVQRLNRYKRSTKEGGEMGLCLSVKVKTKAISVLEVPVNKAKKLRVVP